MIRIKLFKKFLMPCGLCAAIPLIKSDENKSCAEMSGKNHDETSDLPYYRNPTRRSVVIKNTEPSIFEEKIGVIRKVIQEKLKTANECKTAVTETVSNTVNTGYAHSKNTLHYLRDESNIFPRIGAVGIGGLAGLVLGARGGRLKKFFYTSTGAVALAAVCYPKQTEDGLNNIKYCAEVGYNFVNGAKPEVKQIDLTQENLPHSNSFNISNVVKVSFVGSLIDKMTKPFNDFAATPEPPGEKKKKES